MLGRPDCNCSTLTRTRSNAAASAPGALIDMGMLILCPEGRICIDDLVFLHKSSGDGSATEPDSTHPGYDERIKELSAFYAKLESHPPAKVSPTLGHFTYSPADNLLSFIPTKP